MELKKLWDCEIVTNKSGEGCMSNAMLRGAVFAVVTYFGPPHGKPYALSDPKGQYVPATHGPEQRVLLSP